MPIPSTVLGLPVWVSVAAAAAVAAVVRDRWLEGQARVVVERWAAQHRYRIVRCRRAWLSLSLVNSAPRYDTLGLERRRHAYAFEVTVDDRALGGTSRARVTVRGDWWSGFDEDVHVDWHELNAPDPAAAPPGPTWDAAQLDLLRRVGDGESTFRPDDPHSAEAGERFDLLVEHLQAMQRRGLVDCPAPLADISGRGRQYAAVTTVTLTAAGRALLDRDEASRRG